MYSYLFSSEQCTHHITTAPELTRVFGRDRDDFFPPFTVPEGNEDSESCEQFFRRIGGARRKQALQASVLLAAARATCTLIQRKSVIPHQKYFPFLKIDFFPIINSCYSRSYRLGIKKTEKCLDFVYLNFSRQ